MLEVNGIVKMIINAGNASSNVSQSICFTALIIKLPTMIKAGAVIAATLERDETSGPKNAAMMKRIATVTDVNPVRPPTATPEDDSM